MLAPVLMGLRDAVGLERVVVDTYQSVSGTGADALAELESQVRAHVAGEAPVASVYPHPIAFNALPEIDVFLDNGYTKEEWKVVTESRKILNLPDLRISCTAVRVPVFVGHSEAVTVQFDRPISPDEARAILRDAPGVQVVDKQEADGYITPVDAAGEFAVYVSRIRKDPTVENGLSFWVVSDNLRKGAALNAVQIAQLLDEAGVIQPKSGYRTLTV